MNATSNLQYEDEIDLRRYRRFLSSYWIVLSACAVAGALLSVVLGSLIARRFQSTATLTITQPSGATPLVLTPATAKALIVNTTVVAETISELGLNRDGLTAQDFIDTALDVQPVPGTSLVKINVALSDPEKARLAAALLANKVIQLSQRVDRDARSAGRATLEKRLADADRLLKDAEERLLTFQLAVDLERPQAEATAKVGRRASTSEQRAEFFRQRLQLARLQAEYDARTRAYYALVSSHEEATVAAAIPNGPQLQIIVGPVQPDQPMPKRYRQFAILGGLVGLVCGIVAALVIDGRRVDQPVTR